MVWPKGKHKPQTEETKNKISNSMLGEKNHFFGKSHTLESKRKISEFAKTRTGPRNSNYGNRGSLNPRFGRKATEEHRAKQSNALKGRVFTHEWKQKLSESRKKWKTPFKDTKPEKMLQLALTLHKIKFEKHRLFKIGNSWHRVDLFIEPNICVEVDGVYWHINPNCIKRDLFQSQELNLMGYHVIRIRDKDILKDTNNCAENIIMLIKQTQFKLKDISRML